MLWLFSTAPHMDLPMHFRAGPAFPATVLAIRSTAPLVTQLLGWTSVLSQGALVLLLQLQALLWCPPTHPGAGRSRPCFLPHSTPGHDATSPTCLWPQLWNLGIGGLLRKRCWPPAAILHFCDQIKDFVISKRHLDETTTNLYTCDVPEQGAYMAGTPQLPPHTCTRTLYMYCMMVSWSISHDHHL